MILILEKFLTNQKLKLPTFPRVPWSNGVVNSSSSSKSYRTKTNTTYSVHSNGKLSRIGYQSEVRKLNTKKGKLKSDLDSLATGFETFRKLTNTRLKSLQGLDFTEYEAKHNQFETWHL